MESEAYRHRRAETSSRAVTNVQATWVLANVGNQRFELGCLASTAFHLATPEQEPSQTIRPDSRLKAIPVCPENSIGCASSTNELHPNRNRSEFAYYRHFQRKVFFQVLNLYKSENSRGRTKIVRVQIHSRRARHDAVPAKRSCHYYMRRRQAAPTFGSIPYPQLSFSAPI